MISRQALLSAREVAETFGVTQRTLSNWESAGVLIPQRIRGRRYYPVAVVETMISQGHRKYDRRPVNTDVCPLGVNRADSSAASLSADPSDNFP